MGWNEKTVNVTHEEAEFIRARSKAVADQFMAFITSRGLDMDIDTWPDAERREWDTRNHALIEEWKRKA
jgi:hypothetical protein